LPLANARAAYIRSLASNNRSPSTIVNYSIDLTQCFGYLRDTSPLLIKAFETITSDISEYLAFLADRKLSGVTRAGKPPAIRALMTVSHTPIPPISVGAG
jgi:site-specific recombinase XerD